jgi:hypothetical protein
LNVGKLPREQADVIAGACIAGFGASGRAFCGHLQVEERKSVDAQAALAAFDRQNHAGASDALAASLRQGAQHFWVDMQHAALPPSICYGHAAWCVALACTAKTGVKNPAAIKEGAEELLAEKRVVSGAVNIRSNREKMKVPSRGNFLCKRLPHAWTIVQHRLAGGGWGCSPVRGGVRLLQGVNAYWVASATPESRQLLDKPDVNTYCPATGKKLRLKDLVPVKLTAVGHLSSRLVVCDYDHRSCAPMTILDSPCSTSLPLNPSSGHCASNAFQRGCR